MHHPQRKIKLTSGFTILELLLAFALFSMVLLATYNSITHASRTKEVAKRRAALLRAGISLFGRLEREISSAYVYRNKKSAALQAVFRGLDHDDIVPRDALVLTCNCGELWTLGLQDSNRVPHVEVAYDFVYDSDQDATLLFRRQDDTLDSDPLTGGISDHLWESVRGMNLRFLDPIDKVWKDSWDSADRSEAYIPQAVEVTLWLADVEEDGAEVLNPLVLGKTILIPTVFPKEIR